MTTEAQIRAAMLRVHAQIVRRQERGESTEALLIQQRDLVAQLRELRTKGAA